MAEECKQERAKILEEKITQKAGNEENEEYRDKVGQKKKERRQVWTRDRRQYVGWTHTRLLLFRGTTYEKGIQNK
jgi:hypothetical protein